MKNRIIFSIAIVSFGFLTTQHCYAQVAKNEIIQANIVQKGNDPQPLGAGVISTPFTEWATSFSADGNTVYYSHGASYYTIVYSKKENGKWTKPAVVSFSGKYSDTDPFITPDGKKMIFISQRPWPGMPNGQPAAATAIWEVNSLPDGKWSEPHLLDTLINRAGVGNFGPSMSSKGTLFYCSRRKELKGMQSFYAVWARDHYERPKQIIIPGAVQIQDPFVSADEQYIVFLDGNDLYIAYREGDGWGRAQNLGPEINTTASNSSPYVSRDGKTLYYSSNRVKGFYKRDFAKPSLNYDQLLKEDENIFNTNTNILMIPISLPERLK